MNPVTEKESRLFTILRDDLGKVDFPRTFHDEFEELKQVMLTDERRASLAGMRAPKRKIVFLWWLLRSLVRKFTPFRRLLFVLAIVLLLFRFQRGNEEINFSGMGILILILLIMLELKDKLVAHEELNAGRAVQQSLMPERMPAVPGWNVWLFTRSANEVGGDLIDFVPLDDNRYGVALGDVAGKGLSAALLSAQLQATLKAMVSDYPQFEALGAKLNRIYCRDCMPERFASLNYVEFTPGSGGVRMLNAGHMPAVLVRADSRIETIPKGGPALGILREAAYAEQRAALESGDSLIVYSDGLTEARNEAGDFYGEERLLASLRSMNRMPVDQWGERIVAGVDAFLGPARPNDDLSIIILRRGG